MEHLLQDLYGVDAPGHSDFDLVAAATSINSYVTLVTVIFHVCVASSANCHTVLVSLATYFIMTICVGG